MTTTEQQRYNTFPYSTPDVVKKFWLKWGQHYIDTIRRDIYKEQEAILKQTILEHFDVTKIETVLDVGCGYGRIAKLILETYPYIRVYGIQKHRKG